MSPAKTQISLGIRPVWSESSLCTFWVAKDPSFLHVDSEDWSDWVDAQANLSLRWMHWSFCWFCHAVPQIIKRFVQVFLTTMSQINMSQRTTIPTKWHVYPAKTKISLQKWEFSAIFARQSRVAKGAKFGMESKDWSDCTDVNRAGISFVPWFYLTRWQFQYSYHHS